MTQFEWNLLIVAVIGLIGASITYWHRHRRHR